MASIELDLDNLSDDPEELAAAFAAIEAGETPPEPKDPPPAEEPKNEDKQAVEDKQQEAKNPADEPDPQGVATKDGKNIIPYDVLKNERDRARRAEQMAKEMQDRVAQLEAMVQKQVNQGANNGEGARTNLPTAENELSPEDLEALKEDFPTVYKAVQASMAAAKALEAKLQPVEQAVQQEQTERAQSAQEAVQEAIDSVPKLAHIQATNAEAFDLARQFDATLRSQAAWKGKSLSERFAKVTEMVEAALGPIDLPGQKPNTSQPSAEELKAAAKAKADQLAKSNRSNVPTSLSEAPAGQHAAQDDREEADNLTPLQLAEKFSAMTPDQMDAYFRNL